MDNWKVMYIPSVDNNVKSNQPAISRVLWIYDDNVFFLGDNCIILHKLGQCKRFFGPHIEMDINFVNDSYLGKYMDIGRNNPNFSNLTGLPLLDVDYDRYDEIICVSTDETALVSVLQQKYPGPEVHPPKFTVYSFSRAVFFKRQNLRSPVFPFYEALFKYADGLIDQPYELYISPDERIWGDRWLEANGIKKNEQLYVIVDNASSREKLLRLDAYYNLLIHLLEPEHTKLLIFDETSMGKEAFYKELLDKKYFGRLIFSKGLKLREDLCLISSEYVKMVFGPCTGLLHCASGIYNHLIKNGLVTAAPALIVYSGPWDAYFWWNASPLVDCLILKKSAGEKVLLTLNTLRDYEKKDFTDRLDCSDYTADMIAGFIESKMSILATHHENCDQY